jgi:thiol-disulfide isomerase/thioredoxin
MMKSRTRAGIAALAVTMLALAGVTPLGATGNGDIPALLSAAGFQVPASEVQAPDFTLASLDGKQVSLSALKGNLVFVNFWATWCPPCQAEIPSLKALYEKLKGKGLIILGVDVAEKAGDVGKFVKDKAMTFPVLLDANSAVGRVYASQSIPVTYIIDRGGTVLARKVGFDGSAWDSPENVSLVEKLLAM